MTAGRLRQSKARCPWLPRRCPSETSNCPGFTSFCPISTSLVTRFCLRERVPPGGCEGREDRTGIGSHGVGITSHLATLM